MAKFSVRHSVAQAYGLLLGRPFTVIGLTWLPATFYALGASILIQRMNAAMAVAVPSASGLLGQYAFFYFVALLVATAFFGAIIAVPLTRQAFGMREERVAAHLVVGARELRMFFALLRYYALAVTALVVLAVGGGVAISQGTRYAATHGFPAMWQGLPLETWLNSAAGALTTILVVVLASRYGFFLDAIAAVEDRARLKRASALARGNFWSIAVTWFLVAVPAGLIIAACELTFGGVSLSGIAPVGATSFAAILTVGLVVLHALSAGASAGAYSEMAEAVMQENQPIEAPGAPAMAFAQSSPDAFGAETQPHGYHATAFGAAAQTAPAPMEIATPEANGAAAGWMAPPPDAHFGSDPHDAHAHDAQFATAHDVEAEGEHIAHAPEPVVEAVAETEGVEQATEGLDGIAETSHEATEDAGPALQAESQDGAADQTVGFDGHPVPDHAQNAEFPAPPLDPAGVIAGAMQAQSGFHSPPPG